MSKRSGGNASVRAFFEVARPSIELDALHEATEAQGRPYQRDRTWTREDVSDDGSTPPDEGEFKDEKPEDAGPPPASLVSRVEALVGVAPQTVVELSARCVDSDGSPIVPVEDLGGDYWRYSEREREVAYKDAAALTADDVAEVSRLAWGHVRAFASWRAEKRRRAAEHRLDRLNCCLAELWHGGPGADAAQVARAAAAKAPTEECVAFCDAEAAGVSAGDVGAPPIKDARGADYAFPSASKVWAFYRRWHKDKVARRERAERRLKQKRLKLFGAATHDGDVKHGAKARGSGMLLCHFSYLAGKLAGLLPPAFFGLKPAQERALPKRGIAPRALELFDAVQRGVVAVVRASGHGFGERALHLTLELLEGGAGCDAVVLLAGTIFQHVDWVHKQNLMVIRQTAIRLRPKRPVEVEVDAHCMNLSCSCSHGEPMALTHWYFDGPQLGVQGNIWGWFEGKYHAGRNHAATAITDDVPTFSIEEIEAELREEEAAGQRPHVPEVGGAPVQRAVEEE